MVNGRIAPDTNLSGANVMLFTQPEQFIVLAALLLGGWLLGYVSAPSPKKWKRRVREQSESFTAYHDEAEDRLRAAHARAANLTADLEALRADHQEAEHTIATLRAAAVAPPAPAPAPLVTPVEADFPAQAEPLDTVAPVPPAELAPVAEAKAEDSLEAPAVAAATVPMPEPEAPSPAIEDAPPAVSLAAESEAPAEVEADSVVAQGLDPEPESEPQPPVAHSLPMTPAPTLAEPAPIGAAPPEITVPGWLGSPKADGLTRIRGIDAALQTRLTELGVVRFEDLEKLSAEDEMALEQRLALPAGYIAREQWRPQAALLRAGQDAEHKTHFVPAEPAEQAEPVLA